MLRIVENTPRQVRVEIQDEPYTVRYSPTGWWNTFVPEVGFPKAQDPAGVIGMLIELHGGNPDDYTEDLMEYRLYDEDDY